MNLKTLLKTTFLFGILSNSAFAASHSSIEFFASNNQGEIPLQTAYARLTGDPQQQLQQKFIEVMQKNHVEQGTQKNILGIYQMDSTKNVTWDNSERFDTSPYQNLSVDEAKQIAMQLSQVLAQETVAVFVPESQANVAKITVHFKHQPSIAALQKQVQNKLPEQYRQAMSIQLEKETTGLPQARVDTLTWLGSGYDKQVIQAAFKDASVEVDSGDAFLVNQQGNLTNL